MSTGKDEHVPQAIRILPRVTKVLARLPTTEQRAFSHALEKLRAAAPQDRVNLLSAVYTPAFKDIDVKWTMRASQKYRVLLRRDADDYVVCGFVSRGDKRFYRTE